MYKKHVHCLLIGVLLGFSAWANSPEVTKRYFRTISVEQGLSQSTVFTIAQDSLGFVWMGTQDGLNRYDGELFKLYRPIKNDPHSLQSNFIRSLYLDRKGILWIGGNQGLSKYDYAADRFDNYKLQKQPGEWFISTITEDTQGVLWIGSSSGEIFYRDKSSGKFVPFYFSDPSQNINYISKLLFYKGFLLAGTNAGLFRIDMSTKKMYPINLHSSKFRINDLYIDAGILWVCTEGKGLFRYNILQDNYLNFEHSATNAFSLADNNVRSIAKDENGKLWIGTFKGLSVLDLNQQKFENYYHQSNVPYTISQNSVRCIYKDKQNGMWLGTYYAGVNYYHKKDIKFNLLNQHTGALSLNDQVVNVIKQDSDNNIWIGTNDKGLNYWDRKNGLIKYYTFKEESSSSLSSSNIKSIAFDELNNILIGTHNGGLNYLNPKTGAIKVYRHSPTQPASIASDMVYALIKDYKHRIWVGTRSGLDLFNVKENSFTHIYLDRTGKRLTSDVITFLLEDSKNRIWVGTTNGVNILYPETMLFDTFMGSMLSNDVVNCIAEDSQKRIWVGTKDGLNLFDERTKTFITSDSRKDFIKGVIYGIQPEEDGTLWISTNRGLVNYNPGKRTKQTFDYRDGLQNNQFNEYAYCRTSDGMILFGGINGISYFYSKAIRQDALKLKITFTGLEVFNKQVVAPDAPEVLSNHLNQVKRIKLKHDQKQFSIFFNAFNYISPNKIKYWYKLDGFDRDWQISENIPKATYTNLSPGNYVFYVKAVGPSGETSQERTIEIEVLPPWWATGWFYLLIAVFISANIFLGYRSVLQRIRARHQLKMERLEREKVEHINSVKTEFFTNVSHEFRTPLTLIIAPLEEVLNKPVSEKALKKHLELILINAKRLYNLVDQLFEFRKTELGTKKLKVSKGEIVSFVHDIYNSFLPLSERSNIDYTFRSTESKFTCTFDKDAIERICFNLLSNAFKYTRQGRIEIALAKRENNLVIIVSDSGIGIDPIHQNRIFQRYYQVDNQETNLGSGVGLAFTKRLVELHHGQISFESTLGVGTSFTVTIPTDAKQYQADEHLFEDNYQFVINNSENKIEYDRTSETEENLGLEQQKLLIVDDNREIVEYLKKYFCKHYMIKVAYDGSEALALLEAEPCDLIICDVAMPEVDGIHFCKKVKQNIKTCHIPVILLTAKSDASHQLKGLEAGADDYVIKPFSITLLEAKLQNIVRSRRRLKEYYSTSVEIVPENIAFNTLDEEFLREAIAIIEAHICDSDFSVDKFSREIGMSRSNLYLKLKAITGESATDFIKRIRFKKAVELLETRQYTVAQVAYMSGFNSPSYFSTSFKQYYNCMPTEYLAKKDLEID